MTDTTPDPLPQFTAAASGGWCAPSDNFFDIDAITARRGGILFTRSPEFDPPKPPPTREEITKAINAAMFRPTAGGSYIVPAEEIEHLKTIIILAQRYVDDDGALFTWAETRRKEYEAAAERGRILEPKLAKARRKVTRLKGKVGRLKSKLAYERNRFRDMDRIHWDARRILNVEKGKREGELLDVIARLRRGESPAPVFGEGLISMPDVAPRMDARVEGKGCPLADCETVGPHWHGEAQHFDATGKMMPVDQTVCVEACCQDATTGDIHVKVGEMVFGDGRPSVDVLQKLGGRDTLRCDMVGCSIHHPVDGIALGHNAAATMQHPVPQYDTIDGLVTPGFLISKPDESDGAS